MTTFDWLLIVASTSGSLLAVRPLLAARQHKTQMLHEAALWVVLSTLTSSGALLFKYTVEAAEASSRHENDVRWEQERERLILQCGHGR